MRNPLVSVILPTYNRKHLLKETIESVLSQTYKDLEVIVVDDGSTDNTEHFISNFNDERITYIKQDHRGVSSARNKGIENAKGEYIAFLDSDDKWLPSKIEEQLKVFKNSKLNPGVIYSGIEYIDENGKKIREERLPAYRGNLFLYLLGARRNVVLGVGSTVLVKRVCFKECGLFDENMSYREDLDLLIRISKRFTFDYVPEPLAKIRIHKKRILTNIDTVIRGRELLFEKIYNDLKRHRRILAKYYYQTGILYLRKNDKPKGKEYMIKSIRTFPLIGAIKEWWKSI
jgi:glycosyltransferase involved in cell wall biosynthesis